ncbi:MAG: energy transducer TonB [Nitrosomonadales bacterium]|nr:energy transducer TonB [Nitrosomonadales bacterium]
MIALPLRDRLLVVALVLLAHGALLWVWAASPDSARPVHHEMSISMTMPAVPQPATQIPATLATQPMAKRKPVEAPHAVQQAEMPLVPLEPVPQAPISPQPRNAAADAQPAQTPEPADREPDYKAAYLHNPLPAYPMVARRMGWQGRVVLNVEVLASGLPGQVRVQQGSGHEALDDAALQAVRGWRFVPARQGGQVVTKWFLVPIPFILKESE